MSTPRLAVAAGLLLCGQAALAALPVIPGAVGFGIETTAGRGGQVYRVTNLNYDGAGSLKACIDASGPRVCVFEVSGTINLTGRLRITNPNITIAGQTAPSPGITLQGNEVWVRAPDVLIQHIRIRSGDGPSIVNPDISAPLNIGATDRPVVQRVVVDHVSLSWGIDDNLSLSVNFDGVTVRNSIISEALHDSKHSKGPHSKGPHIRAYGNKVTFIGNLIAHNYERNPRVLARDFVFANNVVYNYVSSGLDMSLHADDHPLFHSIVGNLFSRGPSSTSSIMPIWLRTDGTTSSAGDTRIFLSENRSLDHSTTDQWQLVTNRLSTRPATNSPQNWFDGFAPASAITTDVLGKVLAGAGARPADRDPVDKRVVSETMGRGGSIINCVAPDGTSRCQKNAGGWVQLPQNYRKLTLPSNPSGDDNGNGYTNLEEWLHRMALEVEGGVAAPVPPIVTVQ